MDSATLACAMVTVQLPRAIVDRILEFRKDQVSGWIQINFNSGNTESWQAHEHYRVKT